MQADKEPTKRVLLDVNVCIDLITNRLISVETKKRLFHSFINQKTDVFVPAFSIDTIFYVLTNSLKLKAEIAKAAILNLLKYTRLLHTSDESVQYAFTSGISDFEDGLIESLAVLNNIDVIITSNIKDFKKSKVSVYSPEEYIRMPQ